MGFFEILNHIIELLQREGRVSYRALKREFDLDDDFLEDVKEELIEVKGVAVDRDGRMLVWTGETAGTPAAASQPGQPTPAARTAPDPPAHDAERRQLTVMFSDVVDSTKLSGQLDPEEYRDVLRAYQHTCTEVIQRFDGYIAQHLGDALLVYFGYPTADEFDAQRGILAGLGMLDAMHTLNARLQREKGMQLSIRVGIHTGLTVVGDVGAGQKHELLALGEAPNVASRIQSLAQPDTIAISEVTYRLVHGYFECDDLGSHTLKGVAEPQQVYRVRGASGARSRLDIATSRGLTPLVGREQEVGLLLERWHQAKDGQGHVVLLSGEGGIGKSRLVQVLKDHAASAAHTRLECRSSPYYQHTALYPIADLLQRTLRFQSDDSPTQRLDKLARELSQHRLPLAETVPLFAALLSIAVPEAPYPPLNVSPQRQRQKTLETIVAILLELAERQPVLFIVEDLHWLDPTSVELLDLLMDQTPTARLLTLLTCRPEFQPPWSPRSYLSQVTLNRLFHSQIERMATQVAGGKPLPEAVLQHIVDKTDGVPLFVEEMTKAVLESGVLKEVNGQYAISGSVSSLAIPVTLQDSLMARLDRLVSAKGVAQRAAVIGREFSYELLQAVSQLDAMTLQRELGRLVAAELVYQRGLPPQALYTFKHALVQDAAYQSLLRRTRQDYHQRIAQALAEHFPEIVETQPELLAHHFTEAGQHENAIPYWQRAGQRALQRSAHVEAIAHLTQGLALLPPLPETPEHLQQELDLQVPLGPALVATKGYAAPEVEHAYARARELCQQMGDAPQFFPVLRGLMMYYNARGQLPTATQIGEQLLHLAQSQSELAHLILAHHQLGQVLFFRGEIAAAHTHHARALTIYTPQEHRDLALRFGIDIGVGSHSWLAWELWLLGYPDQALQHSQEARTLVPGVSHPFSLAHTLVWAAIVHQHRREPRAARKQAEAAMALATEQGFVTWVARGVGLHGWALAMQGQNEQGIAEIRRGLAADLATGAKTWQPYFLGMLVEAYEEGGHLEEGLTVLVEALAVMDTTEMRFYGAELYRLKGALLLKQAVPDATQAEACFHQALDIARQQQAKSWELRAATSLARL